VKNCFSLIKNCILTSTTVFRYKKQFFALEICFLDWKTLFYRINPAGGAWRRAPGPAGVFIAGFFAGRGICKRLYGGSLSTLLARDRRGGVM
jgi:hypothetical protein